MTDHTARPDDWVPRTISIEEDLRSRLACVLEATGWDRPYDERIAAIRGMCDLSTNGMTPKAEALPEPRDVPLQPWCRDCGPGYRLGDEGCRHDGYQPTEGETGVCRTCAQPIWWETGEIGHRERVGWSDRITRGGDSIVCFKARDYRHVPMGAREAAIYRAGVAAGAETEVDRG